MKFYEVRQITGYTWNTLAFLRKREDAEKYESLFNTKVVVHPTRIIEHEFKKLKDFEDELEESL